MGKSKQANNFRNVSGLPFPEDWPDLLCQLQLFLNAPRFQREPEKIIVGGEQRVYTGNGRFEHAKTISKILWPKAYQWHNWSEKIVEAACDSEYLCITGCGTSSKSTSIGMYSLIWWMAAPTESAVLVVSKTIDSSKKRIWREISRLYSGFSSLVGGYKDAVLGSSPRPYISPVIGKERKKDEAHGLYVAALHGKDLEKEKEFLKGFHPRRVLVIADELDSLEEGGQALSEVFTDNLATGTYEAQFVGLGNDPSLFNALGDMMAREVGKPIGLNDKEWISVKGVRCLRLDAWDSPNLEHPGKYTGLVGQKDIDRITKNGVELNSPSVWIQLHGLHPPEGSNNTVLSEAALIRFHVFDGVVWKSDFTVSASLDPAFGGGDDCTYRTFKRGNDTEGKLKILCDEVITLPVSANDPSNPAEYQIASKVIELCKARGIPPDEFVIGSTGIGRGAGAVLQREWSPRINIVDENGAPTERIVSNETPKPSNQRFDRRVTEIWFIIREFAEANMLRGLDRKAANQLCARTYEDKGSGGGRKDSIQKKEEMLHSPNEADALGFYTDMLVDKGVSPVISAPAIKSDQVSLQKAMIDYDFDASPDAYSDPLLDMMDEVGVYD